MPAPTQLDPLDVEEALTAIVAELGRRKHEIEQTADAGQRQCRRIDAERLLRWLEHTAPGRAQAFIIVRGHPTTWGRAQQSGIGNVRPIGVAS